MMSATTTKHSAVLRLLATVMLMTAISQAFSRFTYSLLFTDVRDDLQLSNTAAGGFGSVNLVAYLCGSLAVSLIVGRWGLATTARVGLVGVTVGLALMAWSPHVVIVVIALLVMGFAAAGVWVTAPGLATAVLAQSRRGTAIGVVTGGVGIGMVAASGLDAIFSAEDWRNIYRIEVLIALAVCVLAFSWLSGPPASGVRGGGLASLRKVPAWKSLLFSYGLFAMAMAMVVTFLVALLKEDAGYSDRSAALAFSLLGVGTLAGGPVFGPLADRFGRVNAQIGAFILMASSTLVIMTGHRPGATIATVAFGLAFTGLPVTVGALVSDHTSGDEFGAAYGIATLAFGAGLAIGPQVGGIIADASDSFRPVLGLAAACAIVGGGLTLIRPDRSWQQRSSQP